MAGHAIGRHGLFLANVPVGVQPEPAHLAGLMDWSIFHTLVGTEFLSFCGVPYRAGTETPIS